MPNGWFNCVSQYIRHMQTCFDQRSVFCSQLVLFILTTKIFGLALVCLSVILSLLAKYDDMINATARINFASKLKCDINWLL